MYGSGWLYVRTQFLHECYHWDTYETSSSLPDAVSSFSLSLGSVRSLGDTVVVVEYTGGSDSERACESDSMCMTARHCHTQ